MISTECRLCWISAFSVSGYVFISIVRHTKQTRRIEKHQSQFHVTLCKGTQGQKVMPMGCDWCISIRLVCFLCRKMDGETYKHWKQFYSRFQCSVHSGYLATSSFDVLFEISQSQPMNDDVSFVSRLCKWATSSKGHVSRLWLVDFDPSCFLCMSKDGWQKISAMHIKLKAGIKLGMFWSKWLQRQSLFGKRQAEIYFWSEHLKNECTIPVL